MEKKTGRASPAREFNPHLYMQRFFLNMMSRVNNVFKRHFWRFDICKSVVSITMYKIMPVMDQSVCVLTIKIQIRDRMKNIDMLIYEVQDMILTTYYENERNGEPMKETDLSDLLGVTMSMVSKKIREIKKKIKENTDEDIAQSLTSFIVQ